MAVRSAKVCASICRPHLRSLGPLTCSHVRKEMVRLPTTRPERRGAEWLASVCRCVCSASEQQRVIDRSVGAELGQREPSPAAPFIAKALALSLPGLPAAAKCASARLPLRVVYSYVLCWSTAIPFRRPGSPARAHTSLVAPPLPVAIIIASCPPRSFHEGALVGRRRFLNARVEVLPMLVDELCPLDELCRWMSYAAGLQQ